MYVEWGSNADNHRDVMHASLMHSSPVRRGALALTYLWRTQWTHDYSLTLCAQSHVSTPADAQCLSRQARTVVPAVASWACAWLHVWHLAQKLQPHKIECKYKWRVHIDMCVGNSHLLFLLPYWSLNLRAMSRVSSKCMYVYIHTCISINIYLIQVPALLFAILVIEPPCNVSCQLYTYIYIHINMFKYMYIYI